MFRRAFFPLTRLYRFWIAVVIGALIGFTVNAAVSEHLFVVEKGDTLSSYFNRLGLSNQVLLSMLSSSNKNVALNNLSIGRPLVIRLDQDKQLESLAYSITRDKLFKINKKGKRFVTTINETNKPKGFNSTTVTINKSLSYDAKKLNVSPAVINTIVRVFSWRINFKKDLRKGDKFIIVGDNTKNPVALIYKSRSKNVSFFSYIDEYGNVDYYDGSGLSVSHSFLPAPLKYERISSKFQKSRYHPILKVWKPHRAIDFKAKKGTPVFSTADGVIKQVKKGGSLGNVVYIQHGNDHLTVYAHLSKFARGLKANKKIEQGQTIGYVGSTGRSTGPHLHYELRYKGERKNPLKYNVMKHRTLSQRDLSLFKKRANFILKSL